MRYLGSDPSVENSLSKLKLGNSSAEVTVVDADHAGSFDSKKIIVSRDLENQQLLDLVVDQGARHIVQMPNLDFQRQMAFCSQILTSPDQFFENPRRYLVANGESGLVQNPIQMFHYPTAAYPTKDALLDQVRHDVLSISPMWSVREPAVLVADEMLMNILKDAPTYFAKVFPGGNTEGRTSSLTLAHDNERLLIWTEDDYGSLVVDKLLNRLRECYADTLVEALDKPGEGAGLGCRIIFDLSVSMSMFVKPGKKTVFCALLPLGLSFKKQQLIPKNLHIVALSF